MKHGGVGQSSFAPLSPVELSAGYGGVLPSDDLRWRVENAHLLSPSQRLDALLEIKHKATMHQYGCIPPMERCMRVVKLNDPGSYRPMT